MATTCKLIASVTLGSSATSIDFSDIPGTYTDLLIIASMRSDRASNTTDATRLRFNSSSSGYSYRYLQSDGSTATSQAATSQSAAIGPIMPAATATANSFGNHEWYIPNYTGATSKSIAPVGVQETNSASATIHMSAGLWSGTAAITSISIFSANAASFVAGSSAFLYGITKA